VETRTSLIGWRNAFWLEGRAAIGCWFLRNAGYSICYWPLNSLIGDAVRLFLGFWEQWICWSTDLLFSFFVRFGLHFWVDFIIFILWGKYHFRWGNERWDLVLLIYILVYINLCIKLCICLDFVQLHWDTFLRYGNFLSRSGFYCLTQTGWGQFE
jgi:hypothetical protein